MLSLLLLVMGVGVVVGGRGEGGRLCGEERSPARAARGRKGRRRKRKRRRRRVCGLLTSWTISTRATCRKPLMRERRSGRPKPFCPS